MTSTVVLPCTEPLLEADPALYPYQQWAAKLLNECESMCQVPNFLVASPTGSGKTRVLELAAQRAQALGLTLYIGEPLIALADQVARRLEALGLRTALRTGPVKRAEVGEAAAVVCTYEALATLTSVNAGPQNAFAVALDEVHFLDSSRGAVLQEILAFCQQLPLICLSGTVANVRDLASHLHQLNGRPTYVIGAPTRPVKLRYWFLDNNGTVPPQELLIEPVETCPTTAPPQWAMEIGGVAASQQLLLLLRRVALPTWAPALIVLFSCERLNNWAATAEGEMPLLPRGQRARITGLFYRMLRGVPKEDHALFIPLLSKLQRGIALHHSQLPQPYLLLVSTLAEARCVKVCFCTSTLSAGINLPVRSVVLCGAQLPADSRDTSEDFVDISPLLFAQLSGRAGRPGYEKEGHVLIVGHEVAGLRAARWLVARPLPPIQPCAHFSAGDVLRAQRHRRHLVLEPARFRMGDTFGGPWELLDITCPKPTAAESEMALKHLHVLRLWTQQPKTLHPFLTPWSVQVSKEAVTVVRAMGTTQKKRSVKIPLDAVDLVQTFKQDLQKWFEVQLTQPAFARWMACLWQWEQAMIHSEEQNVHVTVHQTCAVELSRLITWGFVEAETLTLTTKGTVAAGLRATEHPHMFVELLLAQEFSNEKKSRLHYGQSSTQSTACRHIAALLVGGRTRLNVKRLRELSLSMHGGHVKTILETTEMHTASDALLRATEMWARGQSLAQIWDVQNVAPGTFAKHIVRTADLLEEASVAFYSWTPELAQTLRLAGEPLRHGLPFLAHK